VQQADTGVPDVLLSKQQQHAALLCQVGDQLAVWPLLFSVPCAVTSAWRCQMVDVSLSGCLCLCIPFSRHHVIQSFWQGHDPVALQVLLPYIKSKLDRLYARHTQGGVLGLALSRRQQQQQVRAKSQRASAVCGGGVCVGGWVGGG
jgi:hypothetical protein